jgi:hypothetical protein
MTKLTKVAAMIVAILVASSSVSFAATQSTPAINVSASVTSTLTISADLFKNSVSAANDIANTAMPFGTLNTNLGGGNTSNNLRSTVNGSTGVGSVVVLLNAVSSGLPYTISQTGTPMTGPGGVVLPAGACTVVPVYSSADNGGAAEVGTKGTAGSWVGSRNIYTSNAAGDLRTIQAHYSITDDPAAGATTGVPLNQAAGAYTGTVTFTVTA